MTKYSLAKSFFCSFQVYSKYLNILYSIGLLDCFQIFHYLHLTFLRHSQVVWRISCDVQGSPSVFFLMSRILLYTWTLMRLLLYVGLFEYFSTGFFQKIYLTKLFILLSTLFYFSYYIFGRHKEFWKMIICFNVFKYVAIKRNFCFLKEVQSAESEYPPCWSKHRT
jgi:hypothetical protein